MMEEGGYAQVDASEISKQREEAIEILPRPDDLEIQRLQEKALANFEKYGVISVVRSENGRLDHVVLENFNIVLDGYTDANGVFRRGKDLVNNCAISLDRNMSLFPNKELSHLSVSEKLYWSFKGIPVIKREDKESGIVEMKNLFYVPSATEALDVDAMKHRQNDHYLRVWDVGGYWERAHPTREYDFNAFADESGEKKVLSRLDVAVPYEVYVTGNGERDENGVLMVDKVVGHPEEGKQKISGKWFSENFFSGGGKGSGVTMDRPREFVEVNGAEWEKRNLLQVDDFDLHNGETLVRTVANGGYVNIGSRRFYIGNALIGSKVSRVSGNNYVVEKDGVVVEIFKADVSDENIRNCHTTYVPEDGRSITLVPKDSFDRRSPEQMGSFFVERYSEYGKNREKLDIGEHLQELIDFRKGLPQKTVSQMSDMSLQKQESVMFLVKELEQKGDTRALTLLKNAPGSSILFANSFLNGGLDERVLNLVNLPQNEQVDLLSAYCDLSIAANSFVDSLAAISMEVQDKDKHTDRLHTDRLLLERVRQAFNYRAQHFLVLDNGFGSQESQRELKLYSEALVYSEMAISGTNVIEENEDRGIKLGDSIASITARYRMDDGARVAITVRPEEVNEKNETGQSRFGITVTNKDGKKVNIRLDCDEYGVSLDVGTRESAFVNRLQELGLSHHTQETFEAGFSNKQVFGRFARRLPKAFGWSHQF